MPNNYFRFKEFTIQQNRSPFKVGTDGVILGAWVDCNGVNRTLDIGTGTGLLSLMLVQRCGTFIDAVEINQPAFEQAVENIKNCPWPDRFKMHLCSIQAYCNSYTGQLYDLIISNPPFFSKSLKNPHTDQSIARHDEHLNYTDILITARKLLNEQGKLALIYPVQVAQQFIETANRNGFYLNRELHVKPGTYKNVNRLVMEFSRNQEKRHSDTLTITSARTGDFTSDYKELTRQFYLYF
ncbi:MAG: methyltransferase [Bacteroidetes bacterium]|jgi:tRNA1Val (adenine37-N6)-methyltransferase|nr:methyltransferase [Bacteroidota bacterium]